MNHDLLAEMCLPVADFTRRGSDESPSTDREYKPSQALTGAAINEHTSVEYSSANADSERLKVLENIHPSGFASDFISQKLVSRKKSQTDLWLILNKWIGYVLSIDSENKEFTAVLQDMTHSDNPQEIATFPIDDVSQADLDVFSEGATFTWNVGYSINNKSKVRGAVMRFSRYKGASDKEINRAKQASKEFDDLFE